MDVTQLHSFFSNPIGLEKYVTITATVTLTDVKSNPCIKISGQFKLDQKASTNVKQISFRLPVAPSSTLGNVCNGNINAKLIKMNSGIIEVYTNSISPGETDNFTLVYSPDINSTPNPSLQGLLKTGFDPNPFHHATE